MKKILFVINALDGGGAEKSLVSLLHELEKYKNEYAIDLLIPYEKGMFYSQIPEYINRVPISNGLYYMTHPLKNLFHARKFNPCYLFRKIIWVKKQKGIKRKKSGEKEQELWKLWKEYIPELPGKYDVAISYLNGYTNYFVIDKVNASKKILWIHNEYQKIGYESSYDEKYYDAADQIITISDSCVSSFIEVFPMFKDKIKVLENISSGILIRQLADEELLEDSFKTFQGLKVLSIGRIVEQKNFKLAIESAENLHKSHPELAFRWFVIGKGPLQNELETLIINKNLENYFEFIGVRSNPYPYIKDADVFVQTSIFEGKSIVIDEAKILQKPIICTNYATVGNSISDRITGLVVNQTAQDVSNAIYLLLTSEEMKESLVSNLTVFSNGNIDELEKYIEEFER